MESSIYDNIKIVEIEEFQKVNQSKSDIIYHENVTTLTPYN